MYNYVMLIGKLKLKNDKYYMSVQRPFKNSEGYFDTDEIPITIPLLFDDVVKVKDNFIDKFLVVKGRIRCTDEQVEIIAERFIYDGEEHYV